MGMTYKVYSKGMIFMTKFAIIAINLTERKEDSMYNIAVCDDSPMDREHLIERIKSMDVQQELCIHEFSSGTELLEIMKNIRFAAIFLDIQMEGMNGDETAKRIRELDSTVVLVFYTGIATPTPERFEVTPFRYLVKTMPISKFNEYVKATLDKAAECNSMPSLAANLQKRSLFIDSRYVIYIEKYKKSTRIELVPSAYEIYGIEADKNGKYPDVRLSEALELTYEKLKDYGFGYPHGSYIINFQYISTCTSKSLGLEGVNGQFPIARSKAKEFNKLKGQFIRAKYVGRE